MRPLPRAFYERHPARVARELLGHILLSRSAGITTSGLIVETEAYLGCNDPASRASYKRTPMNEIMWGPGGLAFVYMVHGNRLFNITANPPGIPGAVLIRAVEPLGGIEAMKSRRRCEDPRLLTSGPGRLTQAMGIEKRHHGSDVTDPKNEVVVVRGAGGKLEIASSHRIGVRADAARPLRFFVKHNPFVSKSR